MDHKGSCPPAWRSRGSLVPGLRQPIAGPLRRILRSHAGLAFRSSRGRRCQRTAGCPPSGTQRSPFRTSRRSRPRRPGRTWLSRREPWVRRHRLHLFGPSPQGSFEDSRSHRRRERRLEPANEWWSPRSRCSSRRQRCALGCPAVGSECRSWPLEKRCPACRRCSRHPPPECTGSRWSRASRLSRQSRTWPRSFKVGTTTVTGSSDSICMPLSWLVQQHNRACGADRVMERARVTALPAPTLVEPSRLPSITATHGRGTRDPRTDSRPRRSEHAPSFISPRLRPRCGSCVR